jgi:molecular chaperone Hsp33
MTADRLLRGIAGDYRVAIAVTTATIAEAVRRHEPTAVGALALARGLTALALAGISGKEWTRMSAQWVGRGALGNLQTDLRRPGDLRGYYTGSGAAHTIEVALGTGGLLSVISQQADATFSQGQVALDSRTIDADMEHYLKTSDQVASVLRVLVDTDEEGRPTDVVGVLIQALPGSGGENPKTLTSAALRNRTLPAWLAVDELVDLALPGLPNVEWMLDVPLRWHCSCSRERIEAGIRLLGAAELTEMVEEEESTEVRCDFCSELYTFAPSDLETLRDGLLLN